MRRFARSRDAMIANRPLTKREQSKHPAAKVFTIYLNPDPRCRYPWTPGPAGYCWSYACYVDGDKNYTPIESICRGCELWKEHTGLRKERNR